MKKIIRVFFFLFIMFISINNVEANSYVGGGVGSGQSSSDCDGGSTNWCQWNNRRHVTVEVQLYHYNGKNSGNRDQISKAVIFTTNTDFVRISGATIKKFDSSFKGSRDNDAKSFPISDLKSYFTTKKTLGITLHALLPSLSYSSSDPGKTVDKFADWAKNQYSVTYMDNYHDPAVGDYGFRLVIRPLVSFIRTKDGSIKFMDAGGELECYRNSNCKFVNSKYYTDFPCYMFINKNDVKYSSKTTCGSIDPTNKSLVDNIINETSYIGINLVDINTKLEQDKRCNPDKTYDGKKGVDYCCKKSNINLTYMNFSSNKNNTTTNLTRVIKQSELKGSACDDRCNTSTANGIKDCCDKYSMTESANTKYNTESYMTSVISKDNLKKYCPAKCSKATANDIKKCCTNHNITYTNQTNNVASLFPDNVKLTKQQLLDNCDDRCNTNTAAGVQKCCTSLGITYSNVGTSSKNDESKYVTKKITTTMISGTTCDDRCDPDKTGIKKCCDKASITYTNQTNNNTNKLTRKLTNDELLKECDTRCKTDTVSGIKNCCGLYKITYNDRKNNNTNVLTKVISDTDLYNYCDDRCDTTTANGIKTCCEKHSISVDNVKNNNETLLKKKISDEDLVKYCNPYAEKRCNPDTEGIKTCCDKANITTSDKKNNTTEYLTHTLTDEQINNNCYTDTCNYNINSSLPTNCDDETTGGIYDTTSWACVFKSTRSNDTKIKDAYIASVKNNPFCALYCQSNITAKFPLAGVTTSQGRYLTVNYSDEYNISNVISPLSTSAITRCRTTGGEGDISGKIDTNRFKEALKYTNDNVKKFYDLWKEKNTGALKMMYQQAIVDRDKVITQFSDCKEMVSKYNQDIDPKLSITYNDPTDVYSGTYTLYNNVTSSTKSYSAVINGSATTGEGSSVPFTLGTGSTTEVSKIICDEAKGCYNSEPIKVYSSVWYQGYFNTTSDYALNSNQFRYVSKSNTQSYTSKPAANDQYIDLGHGTLPVHYSTNPGKYDYTVNFLTAGSRSKISSLTNTSTTYTCSYNISCEKVVMINDCKAFCNSCKGWCKNYSCEPGTVSTIYRSISLYDGQSFLTADGNTRKPGSNWSVTDYANNFIYKNRGVDNYDVYNEDPMYQVTLTPVLMKLIRKYNDEMNNKKVTIYESTSIAKDGISGYTSYENMKCTNGRECVSSKIREWGTTGCAINSDGLTKCTNVTIYK